MCTTNLTPVSDVEENFSKLYDKEWAELFNSLESEVLDERERIIKLCEFVKVGKKIVNLIRILGIAI